MTIHHNFKLEEMFDDKNRPLELFQLELFEKDLVMKFSFSCT